MSTEAFSLARTAIARLSKTDGADLTMDTPLSDLPIDSLDLFTMISEMEDALGGSVSDDALDEMKTLGDLVRHFDPSAS
ncbi:MAG: acyl carrier protein [Rubellimicrobium sp.]|nr:acyl carrier protein [Rubellimicrobium sp.]